MSTNDASHVRTGLGVRIATVVALILAIAAVVYAKHLSSATPVTAQPASANSTNATAAAGATAVAPPATLPKLLDLGAGKCIPCKMMAPILDNLKKEYAGILDVVFIDVWMDPSAGEKYGVETIPTQIFYDATGKERFRHQGFFAQEDILAKWKELGVDLDRLKKPK